MIVSGTPRIVDESGAYHLRCGQVCALMAGLAAPAVVLLALAPQIAALRSSRTLRPGTFLRAAAAAVVGVPVGSNSGVRDSWFE